MNKNENATITTVAKINKTNILVIEKNGEKRIAIKPICEALGVDFSGQLQRIKNDEILGSVVEMISTTGADKKRYEMQTIPFKFVFGWLFRIDSRKVKEEAKEQVLKYQLECYNALYDHFIELDEYLKYRTEMAEKKWDEVEAAREGFKFAKSTLESLKKEFADARALTIEEYREMKAQMEIQFPEAKEKEVNNV